MTLSNLDSNEIGRYDETTTIGTTFSALLNLGLAAVSAAFTKFVRTKTVRSRASASVASNAAYGALSIGTSVVGSKFTHASGVLTCQEAGTYDISFTASVAANATGSRGVRLVGSGALGERLFQVSSGLSAGSPTTLTVKWLVTLAVNDTITCQLLQNSGASLAVVGEVILEKIV